MSPLKVAQDSREVSAHRVRPSRRTFTGRRLTTSSLVFFLVLSGNVVARPASGAAPSSATSTVAAYHAPYKGAPGRYGSSVVGLVSSASGHGYYVLLSDGAVRAYGTPSIGSFAPGSLPLGVSATGITLDAATGGYWIVTSNGVVRGFRAPFLGDAVIPSGGWGQYPAAVAIAASPQGHGYYVLRANGGVNSFGVPGRGSLEGRLHYGATAPVVAVGIAVDSATGGYWIATSTGRVVNFDAPFHGSPRTNRSRGIAGVNVTALASTTNGRGYYVLLANGAIENFAAPYYGSLVASGGLPLGASASALAVDPLTGGYYAALDETSLDGYYNPLRQLTSLVPQEIDQGVDYCGSGPIFAIGDGIVKNIYDAGWPSGVFIAYQLTNGPAKGLVVYVAENVTPEVVLGEKVTPRTVIGVLHDALTCLETGWADAALPAGHAAGRLEFNGKNSTAYGINFSSLLVALGARPGLVQRYGPPGALPASWPTW